MTNVLFVLDLENALCRSLGQLPYHEGEGAREDYGTEYLGKYIHPTSFATPTDEERKTKYYAAIQESVQLKKSVFQRKISKLNGLKKSVTWTPFSIAWRVLFLVGFIALGVLLHWSLPVIIAIPIVAVFAQIFFSTCQWQRAWNELDDLKKHTLINYDPNQGAELAVLLSDASQQLNAECAMLDRFTDRNFLERLRARLKDHIAGAPRSIPVEAGYKHEHKITKLRNDFFQEIRRQAKMLMAEEQHMQQVLPQLPITLTSLAADYI